MWDDNLYITENHHVNTGLNLKNAVWAFTTQHIGNWHPVTWLSHMLDVKLYGMDSGRHHLTNLLIHLANTLLLFFVFNRMTGKLWHSGLVAVLFALHPLHVESVAWASERKDVLSAFFGILALWKYISYVKHPTRYRYLWVLLCFILGLMAKPMLVTLPFIFLLLDYWPLKRYKKWKRGAPISENQYPIFRLFWEKTPLFIIAGASSVATFIVQQRSGAVGTFDVFPLASRVANAMVSYVGYIGKMFLPLNLAFFYPHPIEFSWWQTGLSILMFTAISCLAFISVRRYPWFVVGWLWYVIMLIPVIGFVQVGLQAMADRYTYMPLVGLFVIVAWAVSEGLSTWRYKEFVLPFFAAALLICLSMMTWRQVGYWKDDITLNRHALDVTQGNYVAHNNLGLVLAKQGETEKAIYHYTQALKFKPDFVFAHTNLGAALAAEGRLSEAVEAYEAALKIKPRFAGAHNNLGLLLAARGKTNEAIDHYNKALSFEPDFVETHNNLGVLLADQGKTDDAARHYREALRIDPFCAGAYNNLGKLNESQGNTAQAILHYRHALKLAPDFLEPHFNLGVIYAKQGRLKQAESAFREVLRIDPEHEEGRINLKNVENFSKKIDESFWNLQKESEHSKDDPLLYRQMGDLFKRSGELDKAIHSYRKALSIEPTYIEALNHLAITYAMKGEYEKGISFLKRSVTYHPDRSEAYYYLASIYARQKKGDKSISYLKLAVKKGYDNWQQIQSDSNLDNIRHLPEYKMLIKNH